MAKMKFASPRPKVKEIELATYKVLVVDDEESIHTVTNMALESMNFFDFKLEIFNAYSAKEAKEVLSDNPDIALAFVDVIMETQEAGLDLVNYIRQELKNSLIRLIIRTGQANEFPEMEVIRHYDITDFKSKTDLTIERLFSTTRSSIKQYIQLIELRFKYEETYKQMTTHALTKLSNRAKLYEDCANSDDKVLVLIDIVGFSGINEHYGYETGDYVLKEIAGFLQSMYGDIFDVYHLDNDLFALAAITNTITNIAESVDKIKSDISMLRVITNNFNQTLDATIGVAYETDTNLMRKAELALKEARTSGKNSIKYYSDDLEIIQTLKEASHWGPIVKEGLLNGKILAYYQPIYNLKTNSIAKYELLVRLEHEGEIHTPFKFLNAVACTGQMYDIFKFMFDKACIQAKKTGIKFSVNIGNFELEHKGLVTFIKLTLKNYAVSPKLLSLEILEYASVDGVSIKNTILEIHDLGIEIIIDDFGINCSNFGQLKNLPVDTIKIDGSFIQNLPTDKDSQIIVKTIKIFAQEKNIKLVTEFISDEDVLKAVNDLGIEYGQGFHLGMPSDTLVEV